MRLYLDTSVFGGCFDTGFETPSRAVMESIRSGANMAVVSDLLLNELEPAPDFILGILMELPDAYIERVDSDAVSLELAEAYIAADAVGRASERDAHHVALASLTEVDVILSWNFKHIVNLNRIRRFHEVNHVWGLPLIEIRSPYEIGV